MQTPPALGRIKVFADGASLPALLELAQNPAIAGFTTLLVEVILKQHRYADFERFERAMRETQEIVRC